MSRVALMVYDLGASPAQALAALSKMSSLGLSEIRKSVEEKRPVLERRLFDRTQTDFPKRLEKALLELDTLGAKWAAFELLDGQAWTPSQTYYEIDVERLRNLVATRAESLEAQRTFGAREDGTETD